MDARGFGIREIKIDWGIINVEVRVMSRIGFLVVNIRISGLKCIIVREKRR